MGKESEEKIQFKMAIVVGTFLIIICSMRDSEDLLTRLSQVYLVPELGISSGSSLNVMATPVDLSQAHTPVTDQKQHQCGPKLFLKSLGWKAGDSRGEKAGKKPFETDQILAGQGHEFTPTHSHLVGHWTLSSSSPENLLSHNPETK